MCTVQTPLMKCVPVFEVLALIPNKGCCYEITTKKYFWAGWAYSRFSLSFSEYCVSSLLYCKSYYRDIKRVLIAIITWLQLMIDSYMKLYHFTSYLYSLLFIHITPHPPSCASGVPHGDGAGAETAADGLWGDMPSHLLLPSAGRKHAGQLHPHEVHQWHVWWMCA